MKIIALADLHFPILQATKSNLYKCANTYHNNFHINRMEKLVELINLENPDKVWILGDLVDSNKINLATQHSLLGVIDKIKCPVEYLNGNHERIKNNDYLLDYLFQYSKISHLPPLQKINNITVAAVGHNEIHNLQNTKADILLSHFRWSLPVFWGKKAEVSKATMEYITNNFKLSILGDIHAEYEPEPNVKYVNQPFTTKFIEPRNGSILQLIIENEDIKIDRIVTDLPNKVKIVCDLKDLQETLTSLVPSNYYKVICNIEEEHVHNLPNTNLSNVILEFNIISKDFNDDVIESVSDEISIIDSIISGLSKKTDKEYIKDELYS